MAIIGQPLPVLVVMSFGLMKMDENAPAVLVIADYSTKPPSKVAYFWVSMMSQGYVMAIIGRPV